MDYDLAGYGSGVGQCHSGRIALQAQINEHSLHTKLKNGQLLSDTLRSPAFSVVWRVGQCLSGDTRPQGEAEGGNDNRSSSPVVVSKSCVWAAHHQAAQRMSCSAGVGWSYIVTQRFSSLEVGIAVENVTKNFTNSARCEKSARHGLVTF